MRLQPQVSFMKVKDQRHIAIWLYFGAFTIAVQILLGGITRLTGSGLSITEWQPLIGTIPPITEAEWQHSFRKYQQIAQFHKLNAHFNLNDFKSIFFWEWLHRNWARFIGVAFVFPLTYFILNKKISKKLILPLILLFLLGLLQALIGWIMVKSGINSTAVRVDHIRLAIHFTAALALLSYTLWIAFRLSFQKIKMRHRLRFRVLNIVVLILVSLQMIYGAFMAGTSAALAAMTWPDMNGAFLPDQGNHGLDLFSLTANPLNIQFVHRNLAYLILFLILVLYLRSKTWSINNTLSWIRAAPLLIVVIQCILGITTLVHGLHSQYKTYALLHQFVGVALLTSLLLTLYVNLKSD